MSHYQVVSVAQDMEGHNEYLAKKGGLDFGIRTNFASNEDKIRVI